MYLSRHIERIGFGCKDRLALKTAIKVLGAQLIGARLRQQVARLQVELKTLHGTGAPLSPSPLSGREREVLELVAQGLKNKEIAEKLFISEKTVAHHLESIYEKIKATGRTDAAVRAATEGWILPRSKNNKQ